MALWLAASGASAAVFPPLKPAWQIHCDKGFYAPPTVAGGTVYAADVGGEVRAVSLSDGTVRWSFAAKDSVYSAVTVAAGLGYVGSVDKTLYALDLGSGKPKWSKELDGVIYATPAVADGLVVAGTGETGTLYALDAQTGEERWNFPMGRRHGSGLAVADGMVFAGSYDKHLYAIELASARLKWQFVGDTVLDSEPLVADGVLYLKQTNDSVCALDAKSGKLVWRTPPAVKETKDEPTTWSPLTRVGTLLLFGLSDGRLQAVNVADGKPAWTTDAGSPYAAPPVAVGELGFAGSKDGSLAALELETGGKVWEWQPEKASAPALLSGIMWPPVVTGSRLLAASMDGQLYAFEGDPDGKQWQEQRRAALSWRERLGPAVASGLTPTAAEMQALAAFGQGCPGFVVWESNRDGAWDLFRVSTDGTGFLKLTHFAEQKNPLAYASYLRPRVSPDGAQVLFEYGKKNAPGEAWLVPAAGGEPQMVTKSEPLNWTPDGKSFYFVRDSRLFRHDMADGGETQVSDTHLPISGADEGLVGSVSPDLKTIAYRSPERNECFRLADGKVLKTTGGCEAQLTPDGRFMVWVNSSKAFRAWG
ncbi:MAG: PQQ-binding-like beta-propeller repeat protein, partial [Armatimonadetes bacterium]|nr:PQQ-binding-like beta-propeller repeat protein [Armatimonadota bacterium]